MPNLKEEQPKPPNFLDRLRDNLALNAQSRSESRIRQLRAITPPNSTFEERRRILQRFISQNDYPHPPRIVPIQNRLSL